MLQSPSDLNNPFSVIAFSLEKVPFSLEKGQPFTRKTETSRRAKTYPIRVRTRYDAMNRTIELDVMSQTSNTLEI